MSGARMSLECCYLPVAMHDALGLVIEEAAPLGYDVEWLPTYWQVHVNHLARSMATCSDRLSNTP